jgi:cell division protein FtsB
MREMQKKRKIMAMVYSKSSLFILVIVVILLSRATWGVYQKYNDSERSMLNAKEQAAALESRQKAIETENRRLMTNSGVESELRYKYSVKKDGEKLFIITDGPKDVSEDLKADASWWAKVQTFFGKKSE